LSEEFYQLSKLNTEFIEHLRSRTITAILVISIAYIVALTFLVIMLITSQTSYCFFALIIPLLVYLWLITYGGVKHVNNHFSFKQKSEGILVYRKLRENYSSLTWIFILVYYISSIIRLICEIRNLRIINAELNSRSK
jgi:hypothetical protein